GQPDLFAVGSGGDIGTERRYLRHAPDDLVSCRADSDGFRGETRADVAVAAIRREDRHARPVRDLDARFLIVSGAVEYGDVVLAADSYPDFAAIRAEKRLMR